MHCENDYYQGLPLVAEQCSEYHQLFYFFFFAFSPPFPAFAYLCHQLSLRWKSLKMCSIMMLFAVT